MDFGNIQVGLIGFGSVGKQLYNTLIYEGFNKEDIYIFADDVDYSLPNNFRFWDFKQSRFNGLHFIPTLGYLSKGLKMEILSFLISNDFKMFSFVHPSAFVSKGAKIGRGVIIYPHCNIDQGVEIGDGSIVLNSAIIAHDTIIGKCVYIAPGVCLSGFIHLGDLCFVGSSSVVTNNVQIGKNVTIAVGTCITKNIPENSFAIGNPFKLKNNIKLV